MSVHISVVVPTYRRSRLLERCLNALVEQNFPPQAYEIIVVDDGPPDPRIQMLVAEAQQRLKARCAYALAPMVLPVPVTGGGSGDAAPSGGLGQNGDGAAHTYRVAASSGEAQPRITYLATGKNRGPAAARNLGWQAAKGEIIAFTDDDCLPEPDWLANGVSAFLDEVAAVSGRTVVPLPPDPTDHELNTTGLERSDFITANCFYRRRILERVGGFDERFAAAWREDSDLYFTVREHNLPLAWASGAVVVHPVRPEPWGSSLKAQRKSFYNALLYKKHPELYWRYIQPAPPWRYYLITLMALAALIGLAAGHAWLAFAGAAGWLALTVGFIRRRLTRTSHQPRHVTEMVVTSLFIPFLSIYWRLRGSLHWRAWFF